MTFLELNFYLFDMYTYHIFLCVCDSDICSPISAGEIYVQLTQNNDEHSDFFDSLNITAENILCISYFTDFHVSGDLYSASVLASLSLSLCPALHLFNITFLVNRNALKVKLLTFPILLQSTR